MLDSCGELLPIWALAGNFFLSEIDFQNPRQTDALGRFLAALSIRGAADDIAGCTAEGLAAVVGRGDCRLRRAQKKPACDVKNDDDSHVGPRLASVDAVASTPHAGAHGAVEPRVTA